MANDTLTVPESSRKAGVAGVVLATLRFSNIEFFCDLAKANGRVIPIGIMAEIVVPGIYGLGLIARTELAGEELDSVTALAKPLAQRPFDYLGDQFEGVWGKSVPGTALDILATRHAYSAFHFGSPQPLRVPRRFVLEPMGATLKSAVREHLGIILDEQILDLLQGKSQQQEKARPQEEILQLKVAA
jgi:hypothetical protein